MMLFRFPHPLSWYFSSNCSCSLQSAMLPSVLEVVPLSDDSL